MEDSLATRESSMKSKPPISAEYFAKQIVKDFENLKIGRVEYYRGTLATVMSLFQYLPRFFKTKFVLKKLALDVVFANIRKIYNS
ncbi:uncharacterized protein PRCAT00004968001 [Priceomyces carsonii]|uniref:uncharacterized protein n=1 Tax=Priceomyces carsonii TaxID=28549 RepID=UPI002EDBB615|nr:unnamed protein product [Priceomyces carsonii]